MEMQKSGKPFSVRKRFHSFRYAFAGLKQAWLQEHNFRIHIFAAAAVTLAGFYFQLGRVEWLFIVFAIGLVIIAELVNSAIELLADFVSPGENKKIGTIKDIAAASVLVSAIIAVIAGILVFYPHVKALFT